MDQDTIRLIGDRFAQLLLKEIGRKDFAEVRGRNLDEQDEAVCHSHDFCDANMTMYAAMQDVTGEECFPNDEENCAAWEAAWSHAKEYHLTADADPYTERQILRRIK